MKAALVQMRSGRDMARNLVDATGLIREAKAGGAHFVSTPEMTNILEPDRPRLRSLARPEAEDESVAIFAELARALSLWLNIGSLALKSESGGEKLVNRSLLFSPKGEIVARYDKIHLFDVDLPTGESLRESHAYEGGAKASVVALPFGNLGFTICYDIRFLELYRSLANAGADFFTVPSAFTVPTGEAHWHVLLRARAIETGAFVLAAAQGGKHESGRSTYGHSLAVSPWGDVLTEGGTDPEVLVFDMDMELVKLARRRIPALDHGRVFSMRDLKLGGAVAS